MKVLKAFLIWILDITPTVVPKFPPDREYLILGGGKEGWLHPTSAKDACAAVKAMVKAHWARQEEEILRCHIKVASTDEVVVVQRDDKRVWRLKSLE